MGDCRASCQQSTYYHFRSLKRVTFPRKRAIAMDFGYTNGDRSCTICCSPELRYLRSVAGERQRFQTSALRTAAARSGWPPTKKYAAEASSSKERAHTSRRKSDRGQLFRCTLTMWI